jgi:hypothetical protein
MSNLLDRLKGRNTGVSNKTISQTREAGVPSGTGEAVIGLDGNLRGTAQEQSTKAAPPRHEISSDRWRPQRDFARSVAAVEFGEARYRHRWSGGR